jgi:Phosphatidylserine decarboxylase
MKLARNSKVWIGTPLLTASLMAWLRVWSVAILVAATFVFMVFFHRDPDRIPSGPGMISPADGRVVVASPDMVAIFMNHHNVHVNRSPLVGADQVSGAHEWRPRACFFGISTSK